MFSQKRKRVQLSLSCEKVFVKKKKEKLFYKFIGEILICQKRYPNLSNFSREKNFIDFFVVYFC